MGEKKLKHRPPLSEAERMGSLEGVEIETVFDKVFELQKMVYKEFGGVQHALMGMDFKAGEIQTVGTLHIKRKEDVQHLLSDMLERWPMVVQVFEAWAAPDASTAPSKHALRQDVVCFMLHTTDVVAAAQCRADAASRTLEQAPLVYPDRVEGTMRSFDRPSSSH